MWRYGSTTVSAGDDPTVERVVAHEAEVQVDAGDLAGEVSSSRR